MLSLETIQEDVLARLDAQLVQPVHETGIPDSQSVIRGTNGKVIPYIAVQFGDLQRGITHSMAGVRGDDYYTPVYLQAIAPTAKIARQLANKIIDVMLGYQPEYGGQIRSRPGGGQFYIQTSTGATEAFVSPVSFQLTVQILDLP